MVFSLLGQSAILFLEFTNAILHEMASKVLYIVHKKGTLYMSTITHMQLLLDISV